jgi:hypothetical protein
MCAATHVCLKEASVVAGAHELFFGSPHRPTFVLAEVYRGSHEFGRTSHALLDFLSRAEYDFYVVSDWLPCPPHFETHMDPWARITPLLGSAAAIVTFLEQMRTLYHDILAVDRRVDVSWLRELQRAIAYEGLGSWDQQAMRQRDSPRCSDCRPIRGRVVCAPHERHTRSVPGRRAATTSGALGAKQPMLKPHRLLHDHDGRPWASEFQWGRTKHNIP